MHEPKTSYWKKSPCWLPDPFWFDFFGLGARGVLVCMDEDSIEGPHGSVSGLILLRGLFGLLMGITGNQAQGTGVAKGCVGGILAPIVCTLLVVAGFAVWKLALAGST